MNLATTIVILVQGVGIIAALGGVYWQLRVLRQTAQNDIYQNNVAAYNQFLGSIASSEELNSLYTKGRYHPESLSETDKARFFMLCVQYFIFHENLYIQYRRQGVPREVYDGWSIALQKNMHQAGFLAYWSEQGREYTVTFQRHVDRLAARPLEENTRSASDGSDGNILRSASNPATKNKGPDAKPG
jgi:hypothetical protein